MAGTALPLSMGLGPDLGLGTDKVGLPKGHCPSTAMGKHPPHALLLLLLGGGATLARLLLLRRLLLLLVVPTGTTFALAAAAFPFTLGSTS